jgi:hypothetical protein
MYSVRRILSKKNDSNFSAIQLYHDTWTDKDGVINHNAFIRFVFYRAIVVIHSIHDEPLSNFIFKLETLYTTLTEYIAFCNSDKYGKVIYNKRVFLNKKGSTGNGNICVYVPKENKDDKYWEDRAFISIADCNRTVRYDIAVEDPKYLIETAQNMSVEIKKFISHLNK